MSDNVLKFESGAPFSDDFRLLHNDESWRWYKVVCALSDLTGLPTQTIMESWGDLSEYLSSYEP